MTKTFLIFLAGGLLAAVPSARAAEASAFAVPEAASIIILGGVVGLSALITRRRIDRKR